MNTVPMLLERLGALIQQAVRDDAARHGLLPVHIEILHYLARANRYSDIPSAVAEYLGMTRGTVSQSLALLERHGLLVKRPDARHGRRVHLALTPAAEAILAESWTRRLETALEDSAGADPAALEAGLRTLLRGLQGLNQQQAFGICHRCAHFLEEPGGARCGLTGEPLETGQTLRLCREWTA